MSAIQPGKYFDIQGQALIQTTKRVGLTNVVKTAIEVLKKDQQTLTYVDVNRLYATYKKALSKHAFAGLLLWWNAGKLEVLRQKRDELLDNLLKNPNRAGLNKLMDSIPHEMISHESRSKLTDFILQLPAAKQTAYVQRFIQGDLQSVIDDLSSRSDFIERCPGIISEGIHAFNTDAIKSHKPITKSLVDLLKYPQDHESLQQFFTKNRTEIAKIKREQEQFFTKNRTEIAKIKREQGGVEYSLVRVLESKLHLLSKVKIEVKSGIIPFYQLQLGGEFSLGKYKYKVTEKGIIPFKTLDKKDKLDVLDPHERLILVQALVRSGNFNHLPSVFSPTLIGKEISPESAQILQSLLTEKDPSIVIRAANLLKESGHIVDPMYLKGVLPKYSEGVLPIALREVHSLLQIKELKDDKLEKLILAQIKLPEMKPADISTKPEPKELATEKVGEKKKPEFMPQVQQALKEFERIKNIVKNKPKEPPLTDEFTNITNLSKLEDRKKELEKAVEVSELKLYANLPPFAPTLPELLLLYAVGELDVKSMKSISELLTLKQTLQKCNRLINNFSDPVKFQQLKAFVPAYKDPLKVPFIQVFEYFADTYATAGQVSNISKLGAAEIKKILQILMNSGKTYLMLPILALMRADGESISSVMIPEALSPEVMQQLQEKLGVSFQRMVTSLPVPKGEATISDLQNLLLTLHDIKSNKGVLVLTPESKHALLNSLAATLSRGKSESNNEKLLLTLKILYLLSSSESVLADEVDQLLKTNLQYIISLGQPKPFEETQGKIITDLVLFVRDHDFGVSFDFVEDSKGPRVTIESYHEKVKGPLAKEAIRLLGLEKEYVEQNKELIELILTSQQEPENSAKAKQAEEFLNSLDPVNKRLLLDLRETLVDVLPQTFFSKCNDEYGVTKDQKDFIAKPFKSRGTPANTQFSNGPEIVARMVQALCKMGIPETAFQEIKSSHSIEETWNDKELFRSFLINYALPQVQIHPEHISSDGQKLVSSSHAYSGITGTTYNKSTFSKLIDEIVADEEAEVRSLAGLEEKTKTGKIQFAKVGSLSKKDELLNLIKADPKRRALIDTAGWLADIDIDTFPQDIMKARPDIKAVSFYDTNGKLQIIGDKDAPLTALFRIYKKDKCVGADEKMAPDTVGIESIGKKNILRDIQQGIYRLRGIENDMGGVLAYDDEALTQMETFVDMPKDGSLNWDTLFRFLVTSQVVQRLQDNYQAVHQRMNDALEAKVKEKMYAAALKGDVTTIWNLFEAHREIFIQKQEKEVPKDWRFPTLVSKKERIDTDVAEYIKKFERIGVSKEDAANILKGCYDLNELNDQIESKDPSTVGHVHVNMVQESVSKTIEQAHVQYNKLFDSEKEKVLALKGDFISKDLQFKIDTFSKVAFEPLHFQKDLTEAVEIQQRFEIAKNISILEKDIPDLKAIQSILGQNETFQEYEKLHKEVKSGDLSTYKEFQKSCSLVHKELNRLDALVGINVKDINKLKSYKQEQEMLENRMKEFKTLLDGFMQSKTAPSWIKEKGVDLLKKPVVEIEVALNQMKRDLEQFESISNSLTELLKVTGSEKTANQLLVNAKKVLINDGFKGYEAQIDNIKKLISSSDDLIFLGTLLSAKACKELGVFSTVNERVQLLIKKQDLVKVLLDISSDVSEGVHARIVQCDKNIKNAKNQAQLVHAEKEITLIKDAKEYYKEKSVLLVNLQKANVPSKVYAQLLTSAIKKLKESDLVQVEAMNIDIAQLQKMEANVQALNNEKDVIKNILKDNKPSLDTTDTKARDDLQSVYNKIISYNSNNPTQFHNFVLKTLEESKEKASIFLDVRQERKEIEQQKVVAADEFLTVCMQYVPKTDKLYQRITKASNFEGERFLKEVSEIKKAVSEFESVRVGEMSKRLSKLENKIEKTTYSKLKNSCDVLVKQKKVDLEGVEKLNKSLVELENYIAKSKDITSRVQKLSEYKVNLAFTLDIDDLEQKLFDAKSLNDLNKMDKKLVQTEKSIQSFVAKEKYQKQIENLISVNDSTFDLESLNELIQVVKNSPNELTQSAKKGIESVIEHTAKSGDLKLAKSLMEASGLENKRVLQKVVDAYVNYSSKQLSEGTKPIIRTFEEDETLSFNLDTLMASFADLFEVKSKAFVSDFKKAGFEEILAFNAWNQFQVEGSKVQASMTAQALHPMAKTLKAEVTTTDVENLEQMCDFIDTAVELLKGYKTTNEIDETIKELEAAKTLWGKSLKEIQSTNATIKNISKKVIQSMLLGSVALGVASTGFAPVIGLILARTAVSKLTGIVTDPIIEKITSNIDEKYRPTATLLLNLGFSFALAEVTSRTASGVLNMVSDVSTTTAFIDKVGDSSLGTGTQPAFGTQPIGGNAPTLLSEAPSQFKGKMFDFMKSNVQEVQEICLDRSKNVVTSTADKFKDMLTQNAAKVFQKATEKVVDESTKISIGSFDELVKLMGQAWNPSQEMEYIQQFMQQHNYSELQMQNLFDSLNAEKTGFEFLWEAVKRAGKIINGF